VASQPAAALCCANTHPAAHRTHPISSHSMPPAGPA
jgi:hypothetical protein